MSPITKSGMCAVLAFSIMVLAAGCGDPKSSVFDPDRGKHKTAWMPGGHAAAASSGTSTNGNAIPATAACVECHGTDLTGGISGVSCTACHIGGPTAIHPATWVPIVLTHGPSVSNGTTTSAQCANQYCHGATLAGVDSSGPSCSHCHTWPFTPGSVVCGSCHDIPPAGTRYPNMAGRHGVHTAITGTSGTSCSPCHSGSDGASGTVMHYDTIIDIAFLAAYNAKTGAASYNATTLVCSNVSCHGGQQTPNWTSGGIDVNTQCTSCHTYGTSSQNPQYNSYYSGEHNKHVNQERIACSNCHDTTKLATVHFNDLNTAAMNQAAATLGNQIQSYSGGSCNPRCHGNETW